MTYFNFTKVAPPSPSDPLVNVTTHLNNNWDEIETKFSSLITMSGNIINAEAGQEAVGSVAQSFYVSNGAPFVMRSADDIQTSWSAWTAIPLNAAVVARASFTPRYRTNSVLRLAELSGGVQKDAPASAWPAALVVITNLLPLSIVPIGNLSFQQSAAAIPTTPANGSAGYHLIDTNGPNTRIQVRYAGGPGGGNFIMLDGIKWWY